MSQYYTADLCQKFREVPNVIGQGRFHRTRDAQRLVNAAEIVVGKVQARATSQRCIPDTKILYTDRDPRWITRGTSLSEGQKP